MLPTIFWTRLIPFLSSFGMLSWGKDAGLLSQIFWAPVSMGIPEFFLVLCARTPAISFWCTPVLICRQSALRNPNRVVSHSINCRPILGEHVILFYACNLLIHIVFILIFNAKVVHHQCECDGAWFVVPQSQSICTFKISKLGQLMPQAFVCKYARLGQSPNRSPHLQVDVSIQGMFFHIVSFHYPRWE